MSRFFLLLISVTLAILVFIYARYSDYSVNEYSIADKFTLKKIESLYYVAADLIPKGDIEDLNISNFLNELKQQNVLDLEPVLLACKDNSLNIRTEEIKYVLAAMVKDSFKVKPPLRLGRLGQTEFLVYNYDGIKDKISEVITSLEEDITKHKTTLGSTKTQNSSDVLALFKNSMNTDKVLILLPLSRN